MLQPVVPNRCHPTLPWIGPFSFPIKISFFIIIIYLVLTGDNTAAHPLARMVATPTTKHPNPRCLNLHCLNPRCLNTIPLFVLERGSCQSHTGACPPFCALPPRLGANGDCAGSPRPGLQERRKVRVPPFAPVP
jgi:hypothetical protein